MKSPHDFLLQVINEREKCKIPSNFFTDHAGQYNHLPVNHSYYMFFFSAGINFGQHNGGETEKLSILVPSHHFVH